MLLILLLTLASVHSSKILAIFPAPGYSQFILGERLLAGLAQKGHEVTMISPYEPKEPIKNYRTIKTQEILNHFKDDNLFELNTMNVFNLIMFVHEMGYEIAELTLNHPKVQQFIHSEETFDLVIVEQFFSESLMGFSTHFGAPVVLFSSIGPSEWANHLIGNNIVPSVNPHSFLTYSRFMNFYERTHNLITSIFNDGYRTLVTYPKHEKLLKKHFPNSPDFYQLIYNSSLVLFNSHVTTSENSQLTNGMVEIGGFHIVQNKLSPEIQKFLDNATNGAILFSLGSNLKSADLSEETLNSILRVFKKINKQILWKFEIDLPNKPENVLISKWLSQADILAHSNVELFITHGGLLSVTEAVFYGVPIVGIPVFGDQFMNIARASRSGIATYLPLQELSNEKAFYEAISQSLNNERMYETTRTYANAMRDRIVGPLDSAIYWIEYVIRHRGKRFEAPALQLNWFQLYMLDIIFSFVLALTALIFLIQKLIRSLNSTKNKNVVSKKKKKN